MNEHAIGNVYKLAFALKLYKLMWNLKADVNILVLLNLESTELETGTVTRRILYWDLSKQNDMDFVTEISFCKTPVVDEKRLIFRGWKSRTEII